MIAMLRGRVVQIKDESIIIDVHGVGYKVFTPINDHVKAGNELTLHTYLQVRDDALVLFGFPELEQLEMFELLITVSGMGPKTALSMLGAIDPGQIGRAVLQEDLNALTKIPGVGKKTAQRLMLELKDKIKHENKLTEQNSVSTIEVGGEEALEVLLALGYGINEARAALAKVAALSGGQTDLEQTIKLALKNIR